MIQIYEQENTEYEKNGNMTLFPTEATVHVVLNGEWEAELSHPIDAEGRWKYITQDAVVKLPSFNGEQLFRIKKTQKDDSGVTAQMEPIFYDTIGDCWLSDIRPTTKNGQEALALMLAPNSKYSGQSNITKTATAYYQNMNFMEALNGDEEQSFIHRWGGEILFDNFTVIVNEKVGGDYGVEIRYGKNIPENGLSEEVDASEIVTRIYPQAYNGHAMTNNGYVDSPLAGVYPVIHAAAITFDDVKLSEDAQEDDAENGVIICSTQEELDAALTQRCNEQYDAGIDKEKVTISADMVMLQNTEQYKDIKVLEEVSLGDTVRCVNHKLGIATNARVIELEYDAITKNVQSVVIGDFTNNYFDNVGSAVERINSVVNEDGTLMAEKVRGLLNGIYTQLQLQSTVAQKVDGIALKAEDLDPDSPTYGCMIWGTQGIQISKKRTADGKDWDWSTAITAKGIVADAIITGILSDKTGKNYWNLDTGVLVANSLKSNNATITGGAITIKSVAEGFYPIELSGDDQREIKIGPYSTRMEDKYENVYAEIIPGGIDVGTISGNSWTPRASMSSNGMISSRYAAETITSDAPNVNVAINGLFRKSASSSKRYKTEITETISEKLNPQKLYDLPVKMFKYKKGYLEKGDAHDGQNTIGIIVEDLKKTYPAAVQYNEEGEAEMWNANVLLPAMLKMIQMQKKEIDELKEVVGNESD